MRYDGWYETRVRRGNRCRPRRRPRRVGNSPARHAAAGGHRLPHLRPADGGGELEHDGGRRAGLARAFRLLGPGQLRRHPGSERFRRAVRCLDTAGDAGGRAARRRAGPDHREAARHLFRHIHAGGFGRAARAGDDAARRDRRRQRALSRQHVVSRPDGDRPGGAVRRHPRRAGCLGDQPLALCVRATRDARQRAGVADAGRGADPLPYRDHGGRRGDRDGGRRDQCLARRLSRSGRGVRPEDHHRCADRADPRRRLHAARPDHRRRRHHRLRGTDPRPVRRHGGHQPAGVRHRPGGGRAVHAAGHLRPAARAAAPCDAPGGRPRWPQ